MQQNLLNPVFISLSAKSQRSPREDRWTTDWSLWRWLTMVTPTCSLLQTPPLPPPSSTAAYWRTFTDYASPFFYDIAEPQTEPLFIISPGLFPRPCFLRFEFSLEPFTNSHLLTEGLPSPFWCPVTRTCLWGERKSCWRGRLWTEAFLLRKHKDKRFFLRLRCLDYSYNWSHNILSLHFLSIVAWDSRLVLWLFRPASAPLHKPRPVFSPSPYSGPVLHYISAAWLLKTLP